MKSASPVGNITTLSPRVPRQHLLCCCAIIKLFLKNVSEEYKPELESVLRETVSPRAEIRLSGDLIEIAATDDSATVAAGDNDVIDEVRN